MLFINENIIVFTVMSDYVGKILKTTFISFVINIICQGNAASNYSELKKYNESTLNAMIIIVCLQLCLTGAILFFTLSKYTTYT